MSTKLENLSNILERWLLSGAWPIDSWHTQVTKSKSKYLACLRVDCCQEPGSLAHPSYATSKDSKQALLVQFLLPAPTWTTRNTWKRRSLVNCLRSSGESRFHVKFLWLSNFSWKRTWHEIKCPFPSLKWGRLVFRSHFRSHWLWVSRV